MPDLGVRPAVRRSIRIAFGRSLPSGELLNERVNSMGATGCDICAKIPDFAAADLAGGERLPEAVSKLVDAYPSPAGFWDTSKDYEIAKKCPLCGRLYTYNYHYEFSVGYIEESVWIERRKGTERDA